MRREALCCIPGAAGRNSKEGSWVQWLTRIRKVNGTTACQQSDGQAQVSGLGCRGTRVIWRKLDCLIAQSPDDETRRPPERHLLPAPCSATTSFAGRRNLRGVECCPVRAIKEMSGTPKSRSDVQRRRTRDQPSGREPQGDGVPIVVVGAATHQGGRESRPQGEGAQVTGLLGTGRYA
jgi:hypothetical protein